MQRYFAKTSNEYVLLTKEDEHHLLNVIRSKIGDEIEVIDEGNLYLCQIILLSMLECLLIHYHLFYLTPLI